jgi:integrase
MYPRNFENLLNGFIEIYMNDLRLVRKSPVPVLVVAARRAAAAGIETKLGNHSLRATGITAYLKNGGTLEKAAAMANDASTRTTQLYDRRRDEVSLGEVERIVI